MIERKILEDQINNRTIRQWDDQRIVSLSHCITYIEGCRIFSNAPKKPQQFLYCTYLGWRPNEWRPHAGLHQRFVPSIGNIEKAT